MAKMICTSGGWKLILWERANASSRALVQRSAWWRAAEVAEVRWERERSRNNLTALGKEEKRWNERRRTFVPRIQQRDSNKAHSTCSRSFLVQVVVPRTSFWFVVTFSPLPWAYYPVDGYRRTEKTFLFKRCRDVFQRIQISRALLWFVMPRKNNNLLD